MALIELMTCDELDDREIRRFELDGLPPIAVYKLGSDYFATDDTCTHGEASLSEGDIEGDEIFCPFHMGAFNIRTGEATVPPCVKALNSYPVRIVGDTVCVELNT